MSDETRVPAPLEPAQAQPLAPRFGEHRPWLTNLVLLCLVLALGGWVLLGEPATQSSSERSRREGNVFPFFKAEEIVGLELLRGPALQERIALDRPPGSGPPASGSQPTQGWRLRAPVEDRADDIQVNLLLNAVQNLRFTAKVSEAERSSYPFGQVLAKVTFLREGRPPIAFSVGEVKPGAVVPLRDERDGTLYHVRKDLTEHLTRELWVLRDKQLLAIEQGDVTAVELEVRRGEGPTLAAEKARLTLDGQSWRVGGAQGDHAARGLVDELLNACSYFRAVGIAKDQPTRGDLQQLGLDPPLARVTLTTKGGERATLDVGREADDSGQERFVRIPRRPDVVYRGNLTKLFGLLQRGAEDYLDPTLIPLEGGPATLTGIEARFADGEGVSLRRLGEKETDWVFAGGAPGEPQLARKREVDDLAKALLDLRIRERLGTQADEAALGTSDPELRLVLAQGAHQVELQVGSPRDGQPGVYGVKRLEPGGGTFFYAVDLGDLPMRLRDAPLELRHPTLFKAHSMDVVSLRLLDETGKVTFSAAREDRRHGQDPRPKEEWVVHGDPRGTDEERFKGFLKTFEDLAVERWVALDGAEAQAQYGLTHPRRLVFGVRTLDEKNAAVVSERVLLLGQRVGERIHALREGGAAIGLVSAGFLDRLARGFAAQTILYRFTWYDVKGLTVERDGRQVARFEKGDLHWKRDGAQLVDDYAALEDVFKEFETAGISRPETATELRLVARGLKPPAWRLTFTARTIGGAGGDVDYVLLIGGDQDLTERARWATTPGHAELGAWYDGPLRALEAYLAAHPGPDGPK